MNGQGGGHGGGLCRLEPSPKVLLKSKYVFYVYIIIYTYLGGDAYLHMENGGLGLKLEKAFPP
jgi:hypothetical protein